MHSFALPDRPISIAGDWHRNVVWVTRALRAIQRTDVRIRTVLHLGDLWPDPTLCRLLDTRCAETGIERIGLPPATTSLGRC